MWIVLFSAITMFMFTQWYLPWNETRRGYPVNDIVLAHFPRLDCSKYITVLETFISISLGIDMLYHHHPAFYELFWLKFTIISYIKMITTFLLPLEPPDGLINLADPIVERLLWFHTKPLQKDLFFSGHTSMMVLCLCCLTTPALVLTFVFSCVFMAIMLLHNHIHYTIDIFIAPFIVFTVHTFVNRICIDSQLIDYYIEHIYPF